MKRTISAMVGKGSVTHNSRTFTAENVDSERTHLNIDYCNEPIKKVYHEMFDEALKQYNDKQKRKDRKIADYYKHIESGKQEKLFHEIIFQIGNKDDMSATGEHAELARKVLDEYYQGFQGRNPYLRVFSAHLHMDEATPHIHIDFVPFTTGSKRGLETRVSLKQAMLNMGFKGEGRSDNELNRWILSVKKVLAQIMELHGIEWEQKGTHEQHLSVLDYKKQERAKEVAELDREIEEKQLEVKGLKATVDKIEEAKEILGDVEKQLDEDPQLQLPEPQGLMTAKSYKKKFVEPLIKRLKNLVRTVLARSYQGWENYHRINNLNGRLHRENEHLKYENSKLKEVNGMLREQNKAYRLLEKVFGKRKLNEIIEQARGFKKSKQRGAR
ncbi:MAG: plasmid recombination protein [Ruminococcus sp.]|nr:plasmid recombination protein [Ruminococcus sp.]